MGDEKVRRRAGALQDRSEFVLLNLCFCSQQQCKEQKHARKHTHAPQRLITIRSLARSLSRTQTHTDTQRSERLCGWITSQRPPLCSTQVCWYRRKGQGRETSSVFLGRTRATESSGPSSPSSSSSSGPPDLLKTAGIKKVQG